MLMRRGEAERRGLPILATLKSFAAVGVEPAVMGIGPAVAIPAALEKAGLSKDDIDVFELNEAFASQVWAREVPGGGAWEAVLWQLCPTILLIAMKRWQWFQQQQC